MIRLTRYESIAHRDRLQPLLEVGTRVIPRVVGNAMFSMLTEMMSLAHHQPFLTISAIWEGKGGYRSYKIEEDASRWNWSTDMFAGIHDGTPDFSI